jgi:hypothetical protein
MYNRGKYTSDGHFDRRHVDQQIGVMGLYLTIIDRIQPTPAVSKLSRANQLIKWLGGAVGSLFTLDSLGTLQSIHSGLTGIITPGRVTAILAVGLAAWVGIKIMQALEEKNDVGPPA